MTKKQELIKEKDEKIKKVKQAFKELRFIELLQDIVKYKFNLTCNCPTCRNIKIRILKVIGEENVQ
jgi:hypothetical protein